MDMNQRLKDNSKNMSCTCGNSWLQELSVAQFNGEMVVALGQKLQRLSETFMVYYCPRCGDFTMPKVHLTTQDSLRKEYDEMYDALAAPMPEETEK